MLNECVNCVLLCVFVFYGKSFVLAANAIWTTQILALNFVERGKKCNGTQALVEVLDKYKPVETGLHNGTNCLGRSFCHLAVEIGRD